jgi:hypothetical protein
MALDILGDGTFGEIIARNAAELGADDVRGKAGAQQAAIERGKLALVEGAADAGQAPLEAGANEIGFIGLGENGGEGRLDMTVGNAAGAQFAGDTKASLAAGLRVLAGVVERVAGIVEIFLLAKARDDPGNELVAFGAASEIVAHFVNRVGAPHEGAKRGGVELGFGGKLAGRRAHEKKA